MGGKLWLPFFESSINESMILVAVAGIYQPKIWPTLLVDRNRRVTGRPHQL